MTDLATAAMVEDADKDDAGADDAGADDAGADDDEHRRCECVGYEKTRFATWTVESRSDESCMRVSRAAMSAKEQTRLS